MLLIAMNPLLFRIDAAFVGNPLTTPRTLAWPDGRRRPCS
jgi:hypothetical protein